MVNIWNDEHLAKSLITKSSPAQIHDLASKSSCLNVVYVWNSLLNATLSRCMLYRQISNLFISLEFIFESMRSKVSIHILIEKESVHLVKAKFVILIEARYRQTWYHNV